MEIRNKYSNNKFEHLIDISTNIEGLRSNFTCYVEILYAEVGLLGHDHLRKEIEEKICSEFIENVYSKLLEANKIGREGLEG